MKNDRLVTIIVTVDGEEQEDLWVDLCTRILRIVESEKYKEIRPVIA